VLDILASAGCPVKVYGLGERPPLGLLTFCPIHERRFVEDLAGCRAVVCAAGNQLIGESLFLGKPVLAIPEAQHHEQLINAHFLQQMGVGAWSTLEDFQRETLRRFFDRLEEYRANAARLCGRLDGTHDALTVIHELLGRTARMRVHDRMSAPHT